MCYNSIIQIILTIVFKERVVRCLRKEKAENERERLRQEELKKNALSSFGDGVKKSENGNLSDLTGGVNWKITLSIIIVLILVFLFTLFFHEK